MVNKIIEKKIKKNVDLKLEGKVKKLKIGINYAEGVIAYLSTFTIDNVIIGKGKLVLAEVGIDIDKPSAKKLIAETVHPRAVIYGVLRLFSATLGFLTVSPGPLTALLERFSETWGHRLGL
ncbi:MAG: hypothetical protein LM568_02265 [Desulfurococcaceae archaeon]|nr:hypothetical protein [Desulfurococcaceae archaeon]